jgi:uncharacterized protein
VSDPREVVKSGDVVKVKVLEVDEARKRISLTLRLDDEPGKAAGRPERGGRGGGRRSGEGRDGGQGSGDGGRDGGKGGRGNGKGGRDGGRQRQGRGGQGDRGGQGGGQRRDQKPAPLNNAMADALKRAGFGR